MKLIVISALVTLVIAVTLIFGEFTIDKNSDQTGNWPHFYRETVSQYFELPASLRIVKAEYTKTAIMGERFLIQFRLPNTKSPEEWLTKIAADSRFKPSFHKGRYTYDCGTQCDLLRLEYLPESAVYQAQGGWD